MGQRVIVTRVQPQAQSWAQALVQAGFDAISLPLIDIAMLADPSELRAAWHAAQDGVAVMFVSGAAVDGLVAAIGAAGVEAHCQAGSQAPRLWCTGPGTERALLQYGFAAAAIDAPPANSAQFDSEALWQRVRHQIGPGARLLIVRGDDAPAQADAARAAGVGRDWLAQQAQTAGAQVRMVVGYRRALPMWSPSQARLAQLASEDGSIWLISSALALRHLARLLPDQSWHLARALCTHPRIEQAARSLGFGWTRCTGPTLQQVLASLEFVHD